MVDLLDRVAAAMGRRRPLKVHRAAGASYAWRPACFTVSPAIPLTPDQLLMLEEENTCEPGAFYEAFGLVADAAVRRADGDARP